MNARTVNISSLVILLSLISLICECFIYYFLPHPGWSILFAAICSLLLSHFFLESSFSYSYNVLHASFMTYGTLLYSAIVYLIQPNQWISYHFCMVFLVLVNWLIPFIYCTLRDFNDPGPRFNGFDIFFRQMSICLILIYIFVLVKQYYLTPIIPPFEEMAFGAQNFVPFMATGSYLEECLRTGKDLIPLIWFLAEMVVMFIPFGFFLRAFAGKTAFIFRLFLYLAFPALLEISQFLSGLGRGHIDDYVAALLGTLIGVLIYRAIDGCFHLFAGREFAAERTLLNIHHFE